MTQAPVNPFGTATVEPGDDFAGPAPLGEKRPRIIDLQGRTVILVPDRIERVVNNLAPKDAVDKMQDRLTADLHVIDGGTIHYGGNPESDFEPQAHMLTAEPPYTIRRMWITNSPIVNGSRNALDRTHRDFGRPIVGVLVTYPPKERGRRPSRAIELLPMGDPRRAVAGAFWRELMARASDGLAGA